MAGKQKGRVRVVREETIDAYRVREVMSDVILTGKVVSAADFKANCLALMDEVRDNGIVIVITKHSQPVARLVPLLEEAGSRFIGRGAGVIAVTGDLVAPTAPDWEISADL